MGRFAGLRPAWRWAASPLLLAAWASGRHALALGCSVPRLGLWPVCPIGPVACSVGPLATRLACGPRIRLGCWAGLGPTALFRFEVISKVAYKVNL